MKTKHRFWFAAVLLGALVLMPALRAEDKQAKQGQGLRKTTGTPIRTYLNINNISTVLKNDGISDIDASEQNSGFVFPKGSRKTAVYQSGLLWGARLNGQTRVGGSAYRTGLQGGKILSPGVAESPELGKNRIFRVRPDYKTADLSAEVRDEGGSQETVRAQYERDWNEWPATDGAPYTDLNNNGKYDPATDIPGVKGADQTIWFVANDLNSGLTTNLYGTNPIGIEVQVTIWAYSQQGALGNMFFKKYLLINKSTNTFNDMYVSQWSDPDLGNSTDDYAGCDTTLSLGYVYNANAVDATYGDLPPPAVGFDFFQGPIVRSTGSTAIFRGRTISGFRNLPMTAFYYFARGDATVTDPTQGDPAGAAQFYNFFQGRIGLNGNPFTDPNTGKATSFALAGDPQTRSGWVDGQLLPPGDRRIGLASGPFVMAPQDTQEIVVAELAAGAIQGVDRLSAIGLLKFYDRQAQLAYDNFFDLPVPPSAPVVTVSELDGAVILNWGSSASSVGATESSNLKGFKFQGYNVYQLPSLSSTLDNAKRIATFDVVDGISKIEDKVFDASTGVVATKVRQFGNDTGIKRALNLKTDEVRGGAPLVNGIRYYFAVTAYSYNPDPNAVPNNLENPLAILTVVPHSANPGVRYSASADDTVKAITHNGTSDGAVIPLVIDPSKVTGNIYKVSFETVSDNTVWKLTNTTTNKVLLSNQANQSGDDDYLIIDGLQIKVTGPPVGMKGWSIPNGARRWTFANAVGFGLEGFEGAIGNAFENWFTSSTVTPEKMRNVLIKLAQTDVNGNSTSGDANASFAYRYMRRASAAPAKPEFAPFIKNAVAGYAYQDYTKSMPFAAFDMESNPPRRLMVGYLENNVAGGLVDGKYWPPDGTTGAVDNVASTGPREWFFIFDVNYSETADARLQVDILNQVTPMMWLGTPARRGNVAFAAGDEFLIQANHINTPTDVFTFTAPAVTVDQTLAKADVNKINVFPNPYYGVNTEELNKYQRFVTFSHLPDRAKIRVFNMAGVLVRTIEHNQAGSQFERWDLANDNGLPVASGLYIAYIEMPDLGTKVLKIAVIQERQILDRF